MKIYSEEYKKIVKSDPKYKYIDDRAISRTLKKMRRAFEALHFNHDTALIRRVCKRIGIPEDKESIDIFLLSDWADLKEFTVYEFQRQSSDFTRKHRATRDIVRGKESRLAKVIDVSKAGNNLNVLFLTDPTFDKHVDIVPEADPSKTKTDNSYTMIIQIIDFFKVITKDVKQLTLDDLKEVFKKADVRLFSDDPSFQWWGINYNLSQIDASVYPTTIPNPIRGPQSDQALLTKHLYGLVEAIDLFIPPILKAIRNRFGFEKVKVIKTTPANPQFNPPKEEEPTNKVEEPEEEETPEEKLEKSEEETEE